MKIVVDVEMGVRLEDCIVFVAGSTFVAGWSKRRVLWMDPCRRSPERLRGSAFGRVA